MRHRSVWGSSLCHTRLMTGKHAYEGSRIHESILNTPSKITKVYLEYTEFHNCTPCHWLDGIVKSSWQNSLQKKHCLNGTKSVKIVQDNISLDSRGMISNKFVGLYDEITTQIHIISVHGYSPTIQTLESMAFVPCP